MTGDLRVALSDLPGFDALGLVLWTEGDDDHGLVCDEGSTSNVRFCGDDEYFDAPVYLDLSDAATRDRLARYIAARVGLEVGCTAPTVRLDSKRKGLHISSSRVSQRVVSGRVGPLLGRHTINYLADLDPTDDTRLPDGSRRIDAVALGRVAVHAGGVR